jgi:hypothetical protein
MSDENVNPDVVETTSEEVQEETTPVAEETAEIVDPAEANVCDSCQ